MGIDITRESWTPLVEFDASLRGRLLLALGTAGVSAPVLHTAAGHDAGVLAALTPTAMLFVRNPTGVSHRPLEHAEESDCVDGMLLRDDLSDGNFQRMARVT